MRAGMGEDHRIAKDILPSTAGSKVIHVRSEERREKKKQVNTVSLSVLMVGVASFYRSSCSFRFSATGKCISVQGERRSKLRDRI